MIKAKIIILNIIIFILFIIIVACGDSNVKSKNNAANTLMNTISKDQVKTMIVQAVDYQPKVEATGTLVARRQIMLKALADGEITTLNVDIGSKVKRGQLIFEIRKVNYELDLAQAEANLARAKVIVADREREKNRIENLYKEGSATEQMRDQIITSYEEAIAGLKQAEAARNRVKQMLYDCSVYAPYDGVITARFFQKGEYVHPGDSIVELTELNVLNAELEIPELYVGKINLGQIVNISVLSNQKNIQGKVIAVNPKINTSNRTFLVKVEVDNKNQELNTGMFCTAIFQLPKQKGLPIVPVGAIIHEEGRSYVWVIDDNSIAHYTEVKEGDRLNGNVSILQGIKEGEKIAISGMGALSDGKKI